MPWKSRLCLHHLLSILEQCLTIIAFIWTDTRRVCNLSKYPFSTSHEYFRNIRAWYSDITFSETFPLLFATPSGLPCILGSLWALLIVGRAWGRQESSTSLYLDRKWRLGGGPVIIIAMIKGADIGNWKGFSESSQPPIPSGHSWHWPANLKAHLQYMPVIKLTFWRRHSRHVALLHQCRYKNINQAAPKSYTVHHLTISLEKWPFTLIWSNANGGILIETLESWTIHNYCFRKLLSCI